MTMDLQSLISRVSQRLLDNRVAIQLIGSVGAGVTLYALVRQIRRHAQDPLNRPPDSISKRVFFSLFATAALSPLTKLSRLGTVAIFSLSFISVHKFRSWLRARLDPLRHIPGPQLARSSLNWKEARVVDGGLNSAVAALHEEHGRFRFFLIFRFIKLYYYYEHLIHLSFFLA